MLIKYYLPALIKKQKLIYAIMVLMSAVAFSMFVSNNYALDNYKSSMENFFNECHYPSAVITTDVTSSSSFDCLESVDGVNDYDVRFSSVFNFLADDSYYTVLLNTYKEDDFSKFAYMSDYVESDNIGIFVDQLFSDKHNLKVGDTVSLGKNGKFCTCAISQIILKPENLSCNVLGDIPIDNIGYGVIYLNHNDLEQLLNSLQISTLGMDSNQVLIDIDSDYNKEIVLDDCCSVLSKNVNIASSLLDQDTPSSRLKDELNGQFVAVSATIPFVLLVIVSLVFVLFLIQIIKKQSREIGIFLAAGYQKSSIYLLFSTFSFSISLLSIIIGLVLSVFMSDIVYGVFKSALCLPKWTEDLPVRTLLFNSILIIAIGQVACLISALAFRKSTPMDALELPYQNSIKLGRRLEIALYKLPTALRLALSSIVQNLRNFFVVVVGFCASFVLIYSAFSILFSVKEYINFTYEYQNNYDAQVITLQDNSESVFDELKNNENITRMQICDSANADISYSDKTKAVKSTRTTEIIGFPIDNDMLKFKDAYTGQPVQIPEEGILLDKLTAESLGVKPGSLVEVCDRKLEVVAVTAMYSKQYQVVSVEQMQQLDAEKSKRAYVNISDKKELEELCAFSQKELYPIFTSNFKQMEIDYKTPINILVDIIVIVSILLGFFVVSTVSKMTLEKQKRSISILRCQGMHLIEVSNYWTIQMVVQLLLAFLIGLPIGTFSGKQFVHLLCSNFSFYPFIGDFSIYILSFAFIVAFSIASHLVIVYSISRFKIAANVQSRE